MKHRKKKHIIINILYALFGVAFVVSAVMISVNLIEAHKENEEFDDLRNIYGSWGAEGTDDVQPAPDGDSIDEPDVNDGTSENSGQQTETSKPSTNTALQRNLSELVKKNADCVGWIYQKGTKLNYPVMHTPKEPEKYLNLSFYGNKSNGGVPFVDSRCTLSCGNLIIYGHNMNNDTMFGSLKHYKKQSYFTKHPTFELETTEGGVKQYKVFAVCKVAINDYIYSVINFKTEEKYNKFVEHAKSISFYDTGVTPSFGQQIVTLSTCYGKDKNYRLVILAANV